MSRDSYIIVCVNRKRYIQKVVYNLLRVPLKRHDLSICFLWSVYFERGGPRIACSRQRLQWRHSEETSIRGTLGFGSTMLRSSVWTPFSLWGVLFGCGFEPWYCFVSRDISIFCSSILHTRKCVWVESIYLGNFVLRALSSVCMYLNWTWYQTRLPAELKHINKRRKRN